ncbi:MAG TPA: hypothetical protein VFV96_12315 [Verrucomicrobiae bacterium]|nr:hypothetical protein [Verrucomicrobiae bacterium]
MIPTFRPSLGAEEQRAVESVFASRWLGMGPVTERLAAVVFRTSSDNVAVSTLTPA